MLQLHYHPLSSFCWKVLIPLYENGTRFETVLIDFSDPESAAAFRRLWPLAKMPILVDGGRVVAESSIIIEHLDVHHPGAAPLIPKDPDQALAVRFWDRVVDGYLHHSMQRIVAENFRGPGEKDPLGVEQARALIRSAYALLEDQLQSRTWLADEGFSLADCAAAPALFYGDKVEPLGEDCPAVRAYLERLKARPSFARVLSEAEPYFHLFPGNPEG